jgi:anaerobic selenocysteine-containing dehydrogenase
MATEDKVTYCRICEALCGMVATVEDGRLVKLRPDKQHPLSRGIACPKGIAMAEVHNDPDRVLHPLRRQPDGTFARASWEEALEDIGTRLGATIAAHGGGSVGWYMGNPGGFSYSHVMWVKGLLDALGSRHFYTANSQDVANRFAASALLYGSPALVPIPDLRRTRFLLIIGANPLVSHGSLIGAPRMKEQLHEIVGRGGRVIAVDPRRTETARAFEHLPITPDSDAFLLLSLLHVLFAEGLADEAALRAQASGSGWLRTAVRAFPPEETEARTGVPAATVRTLARDLAGADGASVYGRTGSCLGRFGTLTAALIDTVNLVTGNLDRAGGALFGAPPVSLDELAEELDADTYGRHRSRVGGFPDVLGAMPAALMAHEITTPGEGSLRAMFVSAGNPVLSCPDGDGLEVALAELELLVGLDLYVNESNKHADWILPTTTFLEREDLPLATLAHYVQPFVQWTEPVVAPAGEARQEWQIIDQLAARIGVVPVSDPRLRALGRLGLRLTPRRIIDLLLRRGGSSVKKLVAEPHGIVLAEELPTGILDRKLRHGSGRVCLDAAPLVAEVDRLVAQPDGDPAFPLRMIGLRELRSHNSWMHNSPKLMAGAQRTHAARVAPVDAEALGLADGGRARLSSRHGTVEVDVRVSDEMTPGAIAVPHGWGHAGGWRTANAAGGVNVNLLAGSGIDALEPLAGMAFFNGIPVRLEPVV